MLFEAIFGISRQYNTLSIGRRLHSKRMTKGLGVDSHHKRWWVDGARFGWRCSRRDCQTKTALNIALWPSFTREGLPQGWQPAITACTGRGDSAAECLARATTKRAADTGKAYPAQAQLAHTSYSAMGHCSRPLSVRCAREAGNSDALLPGSSI